MEQSEINNMFLKCAARLPYPAVRVEKPNYNYGLILLDDLASAVSETTAIMQYLNHHYTIEDRKISELEECIAMVEMHHMEILNELIKKLGVTPVYASYAGNTGIYWNASFVYYGCGVRDKLQKDIDGERAAIAQYKKHIGLIDDKYVQENLERIIKDEEHHIEILTGALN
ncbi:ferritin-like domain-containing protein [Calorimonas adulescens]|jgi:Ferritin-like domain.|uniref:Bacterioferritin n=1 Tax=Calorimonas adulescens TaxID=2606906 RepID=A0A5D8Q7Y3_9THEO|nr:manganese catalase family protein [Calorimonas adulescens]TZE80855.1 bacterioferritin [Calorimonas adulescens]